MKYSYSKNSNDNDYTIVHIDQHDKKITEIAFTDTAEKADIIVKGLNSFKDPDTPDASSVFLKELENIINGYSVENGSDTPDFLLAEYLGDCLIAYQKVVTKRDKWFGVDMWSENKLAKEGTAST